MKVSVIIPCYNEEEVLPLSHKRFSQVMGSTAHDYELIFVNDGSKDHTEELLLGFANDDPHTKVISFSRNFGHQNAVSAGLHKLYRRHCRYHRRGPARPARSYSPNDRYLFERRQ